MSNKHSPIHELAVPFARHLIMGGLGASLGVAIGLTGAFPSVAAALGAAGVLQMLWALHRVGRGGPS